MNRRVRYNAVNRGGFLFSRGQEASKVWLLVQGEVEVLLPHEDPANVGEATVVALLGQGAILDPL